MKLNEIFNENTEDQVDKIRSFMESYGLSEARSDYQIKSNYTVDVHKSASFSGTGRPTKIQGSLPVKFDHVDGSFNISNNALTTLEGCPTRVEDTFNCSRNPKITSLQFMPSVIGKNCNISNTGITSLVDVHKHIRKFVNLFEGKLTANFHNITEGGIGLILIRGLVELSIPGGRQLPEPFQIIEKYLGKPDSLFDCQTELIDAGFEEHAKL